MTSRPRIALYAPMENPSATVPSGIGRAGALMQRALEQAGFAVITHDLPRCYDGHGDPAVQASRKAVCEAAASRLLAELEHGAAKPVAWFTYHPYYKSPDWIGPRISRTLNIPYAVAEASHAPKRAHGPWALGHEGAERAIRQADIVFAATRLDEACLRPLIDPTASLVPLKPFIDPSPFVAARRARTTGDNRRVKALAAAMMRHPRKRESYRILARAWSRIDPATAELTIAGDGPMRPDIEAEFASSRNVRFIGALAPAEVAAIMAQSDLFLWPGYGEAYGLTYLEAQAAALPAVALRERGVPDVVHEGDCGLLTDPGDETAYAEAIRTLIESPDLRRAMGWRAQATVLAGHTIEIAAQTIAATLMPRIAR